MYKQVLDPVSGSLGLSAIFAVLPLLALFILLGVLKIQAWIAAVISLVVGLLVAVVVYSMPVGQSLLSASEGAAFGFFPILWIVINAIWVYNLTVATGHFDVLRRSFERVSADQRIQAIIVAFCFGALLEALAGFGTPVAITIVMMIALGFQPLKAASVALIANTAPVAFGALATPIVTLATVSSGANDDKRLTADTLGAMVGRQTPFLALVVPLVLVYVVDGRRGLRQTWLPALLSGLAFGITQFLASNYLSIQLTDIVAALVSAAVVVVSLRFVPTEAPAREPAMAGGTGSVATAEPEDRPDEPAVDTRAEVVKAYAPYLVIIAIFVITNINQVKEALAKKPFTYLFHWPGLNVGNPQGKPLSSMTFTFNWLPAAGTLMILAGIITAIVLRIPPRKALAVYLQTYVQLRWAILTVMAVLGLAYVMNQSGQTGTLGAVLAQAGGVFAFLAAILGWLGVALTGSDTSSNALFGALQVQTAAKAGLDPVLLAAANSSGGVMGKMISPQNLAIAAAAVGMAGQEGVILRKVLGWSLVLLIFVCVIVTLQATPVLSWMVPG